MPLIWTSFVRRLSARVRGYRRVSSKEQGSSENSEEVVEHVRVPGRLFCEIRQEWDAAEEVIKLSEQVTADVVIPAIQELRYAGRRLVDALNASAMDQPESRVTALLEDARFSCHRARHDAIDAAITFMSIDADNLARQMGYDVVHNSFPDYVNFVARLDEARLRIAESRKNRGDRDTIYASITSTDFPTLVQDYKALRRSETVMRIIVGRKKIGLWVGVVIGLLGYLLSFYFWAYPRPASTEEPPHVAAPATPEVVQPPPRGQLPPPESEPQRQLPAPRELRSPEKAK